MKAFIIVVDDNGRILCKDRLILPIEEETILNPYEPPMKESRFYYTITHIADFQDMEVKK